VNIVNMHEAKTHLSKLVAKAVKGEPFVIAKAGKPMVKVTAIDEPAPKPERRLGFMKGQMTIPGGRGFKDDFKDEIEEMFGLNE
jgi:prevent-host-death family protein